MELPISNPEFNCQICDLLDMQINTGHELWTELHKTAKYKLFHGACRRCDDAKSGSLVRSCGVCRHLGHLLICYLERPAEIFREHVLNVSVTLDAETKPYLPILDECDMCRFIYSFREDPAGRHIPQREYKSREFGIPRDHRNRYCGIGYSPYKPYFGWFGPEMPNAFERRIRKYIDWNWACDWLRDLPKVASSNYERLQLQGEICDLRLIDVFQACVVRLPTVPEYMALSYVWGPDSEGQFRCLKSNVNSLEQPGALEKENLPATISDAISVCKRLQNRYLWVDRICIIQDDSSGKLLEQLRQMAAIYHQAKLTIVAATGDTASQGLAGVSCARKGQNVLRFDGDFELVEQTANLDQCLYQSKWDKRGWTYQEYLASQRLLAFTDSGMFLKIGFGPVCQVRAEGGVKDGHFDGDEPCLSLIQRFTWKELTYSTDVLRASSGILHAVYGNRTSFGMPWDEFDPALLWMPTAFDRKPRISTATDIYPTWSWTFSNCPIHFLQLHGSVFSLAYWGKIITGEKTTLGSLVWSPLSPKPHTASELYKEDNGGMIKAALAWLNGCLRSKTPRILVVDCSKDEYGERLEERWSKWPSLYWNDAFHDYEKMRVFDCIEPSSINHEGCLLVHTQKTVFRLDARGQFRPSNRYVVRYLQGSRPIIIRTLNNGIAGSMHIDDCAIRRLQTRYPRHAELIALSCTVRTNPMHAKFAMRPFNTHYLRHLTVGQLYGCPCSLPGEEASKTTHIAECPQHLEFCSSEPLRDLFDYPLYYDAKSFREEVGDDHYQAYSNHVRRLSYYDINGELLHHQDDVPSLWVMLIAPSPDNSEER